jgi:hypothetical protein
MSWQASLKPITPIAMLLAASCGAAGAEQKDDAAWRRVAALEEIAVTYCLGDRSMVHFTSSHKEQRALYTPAFYEKCSSGSGVFHVWPCCAEGARHQVIRSRDELERYFSTLLQTPAVAAELPAPRQWVDPYLQIVDRLIDFDREVLVLTSTPYGPTGMARASLELEENDGTLTAAIRITVPPPPLTPDTSLFRFAFAVSRSSIQRVEIVTIYPAIPDLGVPSSTEATANFLVEEGGGRDSAFP